MIITLLVLTACSTSVTTSQVTETTTLTTSTTETTSTTTERSIVSPDFIGSDTEIVSPFISIPEWMNDSVMYEVNFRQYTEEGTFDAFREQLPRLQELGVEVLWFMPIHEISITNRNGSLGSYYSITDYYSINHEFGNLQDFQELVTEAKSMGFRIIMDIVFDHTGWDSLWITNHPEYYIQQNGQIVIPRGTNWTDVAELDTSRSDVIEELSNVLTYWVSEFDIDGFRCDFASGVEKSTWEALRDSVTELNPEIFFLAEDDSIYSWFDTFNANYGGWSLLGYLQNVYSGGYTKANLISYLKQANTKYPNGTFPLNFITNHDINSWDNTIVGRFGNSADLMTMLTFTLPGMPLIYSGQESSLEHQLAFFDKDLIVWNNYDKQDFLQTLVSLKKNHEALFNNNFTDSTDFLYNNHSRLLSFVRFDTVNNDYVMVIANLSASTITRDVHIDKYFGDWNNYETGESITLEVINEFSLSPYSYIILTR